MKLTYAILGALSVFLLGCGGSTTTPTPFLRGLYTGTLTDMTSGTAQSVPVTVALESDGSFVGHASTDTLFLISNQTVRKNNIYYTASTQLSSNNGKLGLIFTGDFSKKLATGVLTWKPVPTLGSIASVPPNFGYFGEWFIVSKGSVTQLGYATANVNSDGTWDGYCEYSKVPKAIHLLGQFNANGTISDGVAYLNNTNLAQSTQPVYSFDGTNLIVRYDDIPGIDGSVWLTLSKP